jgi:type IV secretory pathway protease TraF
MAILKIKIVPFGLSTFFTALLSLLCALLWMSRVGWPVHVTFNASASMPRGAWRITALALDPLRPGQILAVQAPPNARALGCVRESQLLLKEVVAVGGERVCLKGGQIHTSRGAYGKAAPKTAPTLAWEGCKTLPENTLFLATPHERSCDSRYFGWVSRSSVVGNATPILTIDGENP